MRILLVAGLALVVGCQLDFSFDRRAEIFCVSNTDCPKGVTCDAKSGRCMTCDPACAPGQQCLSGICQCTAESCNGCCIGSACISDVNAQSCGIGGSACITCQGLTPSCQDGLCTAQCDQNAPCGSGCCAADGCHDGVDGDACGLSGACINCEGSAAGNACLNGACGCLTSSDCPQLFVCSQGRCAAACSPTTPCNSGCCDTNGACQPGNSASACGISGGNCMSCDGAAGGASCTDKKTCGCTSNEDCVASPAGTACLASGVCGCVLPTDCPPSSACVTRNGAGVCTGDSCNGSTSTCTGSCCADSGACATAQATANCGLDGSNCVDCTGKATGHRCVAGLCGCNDENDCPQGNACQNHVCGTDCTGGLTCNDNYCCKSNACALCCTSSSDCAANAACNLISHQCGPCSDAAACAAGCCDNGTCRSTCSGQTDGNACITSSNPDHCGCANGADCPANQVCNTTTNICTFGPTCNDTSLSCSGCCVGGTTCGSCSTLQKPVCINGGTASEQCGCAEDGDCPGFGSPDCDTGAADLCHCVASKCVQCLSDSDCGSCTTSCHGTPSHPNANLCFNNGCCCSD